MTKCFLDKITDCEIETFRIFWDSLDHKQCKPGKDHWCVHSHQIVSKLYTVWPWIKEPIQMGILFEFVHATLHSNPVSAGHAINKAVSLEKEYDLTGGNVVWPQDPSTN